MKWVEILRKDKLALLQSENNSQYAVASGYNPDGKEDEQWSHASYFMYYGNEQAKALYLQAALDMFRARSEENYIPRYRLEELATKFKDGLLEDDKEEAMIFFDEECELTDSEKEWFGITDDIEE
jgi:hypothetical protein